ncbi:hypothetical protein Bca4012_054091 [Brassica carinata]
METIHMQHSSNKHVSGSRQFKNPRKRSSRGSPAHPQPPPSYSQPPLLPLPRVNSSSLPPQRVNNFRPRMKTLPRAQARATSETQQKKVEYVESAVQRLTRNGSVPVRSNHPGNFPKGFDGYPGPAIILLSPPPSSLPMPRFTIKPKLRCNAEAVGKVNDVASDNIRRVLRLR